MRGVFPPIMAAIVLSLGVSLMLGCGEKSGGAGSVSPLEGEPMILDAVLALDVVDDRPNGITDTFRTDDERIYLWIYWVNVEGRHTVRVEWFTPSQGVDEPPYLKTVEHFNSRTGDRITWFYIDRPPGGFERGEWQVFIYLDNLFERSFIFYVE